MAITLKSNIVYSGDPAALPYELAPLPRGSRFYVDFQDPVSILSTGSRQRLAGNVVSLNASAGAAVLRAQGGGFHLASAGSLDRFRWSDDGARNLGLSLAHSLDRNATKWDPSSLAVTAAAVATAAGNGYDTWYSLTGDGTSAVHGVTWPQSLTSTYARVVVVEVAQPESNAAPHVRIRVSGQSAYGIYDLGGGVCRGSGATPVMRRTAQGWLLLLFVDSGTNADAATLSLVGDYEAAGAANAEALSISVLFRAFKTQGYTGASNVVQAGDWLPEGGVVAADAPTATLLEGALDRSQPWTVLTRMQAGDSPKQTIGTLMAIDNITIRWGTSDERLLILNGSTIVGYLDRLYVPGMTYHVLARYDGTNLVVAVAAGDAVAAEFKSFSITKTLAANAAVIWGNSSVSNSWNGTLQKLVGWQALKTDAEIAAFMSSLAY